LSARKQTFIQGAMILLAAGIVNRLLGFVPRIALPRMIGAEGVGLIQLVYPIMIVLLTIIAGGLPLAVAKLVAEADSRGDEAAVRRIVQGAMTLALALAFAASFGCLLLADWVTMEMTTDPRIRPAFLTMVPVLPLAAASAIWRGYFQGKMNMLPSAYSSTTETLVRIALSLVLAAALLPYGLAYAAAGAMLGMVAGELAGLLVLWRQVMRERKPAAPRSKTANAMDGKSTVQGLYTRLIGIAAPVTGSRMVGSLAYLLESILTTRSLTAAGLTAAVATAQYGALQGMIIPLLLLPGVLTHSLAVSLVPALSEAAARKDWSTIHKRLHQSMRLAVVSGAPFIVLMGLLAEPICLLLYGDDSMAGLLRWLAPVAVFLYLQAPLQAALQALDRPGTALFNTLVGAAVKLALIVQLAAQPSLGIHGAVIAIGVNMMLVTLLHWISVARLTGFRLDPRDFLKVSAAMLIMGACAQWLWNTAWLPLAGLNLLGASAAGMIIYVVLMPLMGLVDRHDTTRIPWIGRRLPVLAGTSQPYDETKTSPQGVITVSPMPRIAKTRISSPILSGLIWSFIWLGAGALLLSVLLTGNTLREHETLPWVLGIHAFSAMAGGFVAARRSGQKGWYYGIANGAIYATLIVLAGFLALDAGWSLRIALLLGVTCLSGTLGGMLGVNAASGPGRR